MEKTLRVINEMESAGIISQYAIGGAIAAIFYIEPFSTFDVDVFINLPTSGLLITLYPIYRHLESRGYQATGETVDIEGWPVQFLPVSNPLIEEALEQANEVKFENTTTRVFSAEHLIAIMIQTGRPKDIARIQMFREDYDNLDNDKLESILMRHGLLDQWYTIRR